MSRPPQKTRKPPSSSSSRASPFSKQEYVVEGLAAVAEYVKNRPDAITHIACVDTARKDVERVLKGSAIDLKIMPLDRDTRAPGDQQAPVQARVLVKAIDQNELTSRLKQNGGRPRDVILALDHITDPRNLGAIVRSAAFFGVREVIAPERRQVLFTQASVATAQGGFALTELAVVTNLARALRDLKDAGYWIIGTAMDGEPIGKVKGVYERVVLVLGAEDTGLSQNVRELCDRLVAIGGAGKLDSLNVSVAAGIFLHELC